MAGKVHGMAPVPAHAVAIVVLFQKPSTKNEINRPNILFLAWGMNPFEGNMLRAPRTPRGPRLGSHVLAFQVSKGDRA